MADKPQENVRTLSHFGFYRFTDRYWQTTADEKADFHERWLHDLRGMTRKVDVYQISPAKQDIDFMVWSATAIPDECDPAAFFTEYTKALAPHRHLIAPVQTLWGYTKPSVYSGGRSAQEIDPFAEERKPYFVMYPFVKTVEWYLRQRSVRQNMMNEHIRVGRQYPEITQLLLYSVGLDDQEFIVAYETDDIVEFSGLVSDMRGTEVRRFTERDTPIYTAIHHPAEETLALWG